MSGAMQKHTLIPAEQLEIIENVPSVQAGRIYCRRRRLDYKSQDEQITTQTTV